MDISKVEAEQETECSHQGRGRGRGVKNRGQNQRSSPRNSPTASRRPPRALYTRGAFSKRRNTDGQTKQVSSEDQQDCESVLENNENKGDSMSENEKSLGCDELNVNSSSDSSLVENKLNDTKEKKCTKKSLNDSTNARVGSLHVTTEANCIDSNCDNSIDNLQSKDSTEHSIPSDCSVGNVHTSSTSVLLENDQERVSYDSNGKASKKAIKLELPTMKELEANSSVSSSSKTIPNQKQVSKIAVSKKIIDKEESSVENEKQENNIKAPVSSVSEQLRTNTESSDIHDHKTNVKDSVKVNSGIKSVSDASNKDSSGSINEIDQASQGKTMSQVFRENDKNHEEQSENKQKCEVTLNDEDTKRSSQKNERPKSHESKMKDELQSESESLHNENNLNNEDSEIIPGNDDCLVSDENVKNYQGQSDNECPHDRNDLSIKGNRVTLVGNDKALVNSDFEEKVKAQSKELQCKQEDLNDKVYVKVVQGKNDVMIKSIEKLVEQESSLNDAEIEINESVVDSENKNQAQAHSQSKSKRQSKKEEKAKKKEEKLKKKQIKTRSEKTLKGHGIKEKVTAKECEVSELVNKEGNNKGVKIKPEKGKRMSSDEKVTTSEVLDLERKGQSSQQENGKMTDAMAGDQGLKIVKECKDTLLRLSVSEDLEGSENENSAEEDWEKTWDDDGECLDANLLAEVRR